MDLRNLQCFVAVAESGSVAAAAGRLNRVPSGVSTRLRQLENSLGTVLFNRDGRALRLNPAGERFLDAARDLLTRADQARTLLHSDQPQGQLRLASMESTAAAHLPQLLSSFYQQWPAVQMSLKTLPSWHAIAALERGEIDAAFVSADAHSTQLDSLPVFAETLLLLSGPGVNIDVLPDSTPLIAFVSGCAYRQRLQRWAGQRYRQIMEVGSYHALLSCICAGIGVGLAPESVLATFPDAKLLQRHPLPKDLANDSTCLVWHPLRDSAALRALRNMLQTRHSMRQG